MAKMLLFPSRTNRRALNSLYRLSLNHHKQQYGSSQLNCIVNIRFEADKRETEEKNETRIPQENLWRICRRTVHAEHASSAWPMNQQGRYLTSTSTAAKDNNDKQNPENISKSAKNVAKKGVSKMRELFQKYGWTFVGTYGVIYITTLATIFVAINWGWMDPPSITFGGVGSENILEGIGVSHEDAPHVKDDDYNAISWILKQMENFDLTRPYAEKLAKNPNLINLGIAWVATKLTEPIRLGVAIGLTPKIAKALGMASAEDEVAGDEQK